MLDFRLGMILVIRGFFLHKTNTPKKKKKTPLGVFWYIWNPAYEVCVLLGIARSILFLTNLPLAVFLKH